MLRKLFIVGVLSWAGQSFAAATFQGMSWRADSRVDLNLLIDNARMNFTAIMRDGDTASVKQDAVTVELKSYLDYSGKGALPFVTILVLVDGQDMATLLILEKDGAAFRPLTGPIMDRRASIQKNLAGIITRLKDPSVRNWGAEQSLKAMAQYFTQYPRKQLFDFYDKVELGTVELPKPIPTASGSARPQSPAGSRPMNPQVLEGRTQAPANVNQPAGAPGDAPEDELYPGGRQRQAQQQRPPPPPQYRDPEMERRRQWEYQQARQGYGNYNYDPRYQQRPPPPPQYQQRGFFEQFFGR